MIFTAVCGFVEEVFDSKGDERTFRKCGGTKRRGNGKETGDFDQIPTVQ